MRIGVDLGGTKVLAVALDDAGTERARIRRSTPTAYADIVTVVAEMVHSLEGRVGERCTVGVGTPGAPSLVTGRMKNCNTTCLNGQPLERDLSAALGRAIRLANDANCFALSEARDGAAAGARSVFGVIVGTGTGGGLVIDGQLLIGANAIGGEWGHNPLPWPTPEDEPKPDCYCGKAGCLETYLSGPGMARDHRHHSGENLEPPEIAARADAGDAGALATLARHRDRMARGLATVVNLVDPEVVVLGGGLSNLDGLYRGLTNEMEAWVFSDEITTRVCRPVHGDASGVRGAAWLWPVGAAAGDAPAEGQPS